MSSELPTLQCCSAYRASQALRRSETFRGVDWQMASGSFGKIQGDQNGSVHLMIIAQKTRKNIFKSFNLLP
jgi:hypothetical protein